MSLDSTTISILLSVVSIINSYIIVGYSYRYGVRKKRGDIVKVIFASVKKRFKNTSIRLEVIRSEVILVKFFIYGAIFSIFLLIPHLEKDIYYAYGASLVLYGVVTPLLFTILFLVGNILKDTDLEAKIQSYWLYVFIKFLYPTVLDLLFIIEFYLFLALYVYDISAPPPSSPLSTYYLLLILRNIAIIFVAYFSILMIIFAIFKPMMEDIRLFVDLESVIFKDVRDSIEIRVWAGGSVYEGKVKGIGDNLVIYSIDSQSRVHIIRIRWDSIHAFEVIVSKQSSMGKSYFT